MANTPKPRSYQQILSDMIDTFVGRTEIERLKVGNPILTILEAAAQSDTRNTQDYFALLNSISLDSATGIDLDNMASREGTARLPAKSTTGLVNFGDSTINKISTSIYQGATAPSPNTTALRVEDATSFPPSGRVYLGRGTSNYEGALDYTSKTDNGAYWTLTLSGSGTSKFHNIGESVILAQNGTRIIPAGTSVQVPQGATDSIVFNTINQVFIEDGEVIVENVEIISELQGKFTVPAKSIKEVLSEPFAGITVTNPLALTNGLDVESDIDLRERIRILKQSRVNGTTSSIEAALLGASSEGKTIVSSKIYENDGVSTVYIDDGNGYEESFDGVAYEILTNSALGGEQLFQLSQRPVALAYLQSSLTAPFELTDGSVLAVNVGGVLSEVTFSADLFSDINSATAFEIVAAINGDSNLLFSAKTVNGGSQVIIFSKTENQEDIQITTPSSGTNANQFLNFPSILNYTLRLFKNDILLFKDGRNAVISSKSQGSWNNSIVSGDTIQIKVDGTTTQTVTVSDTDFITYTSYGTVSSVNSLESWANVLNNLIAGVTVTHSEDVLIITSNKGAKNNASVQIVGGTLISKGMFDGTEISNGVSNDYTLNRNLSQIKLNVPLQIGDKLTVSTENTRPFLESALFTTGSVTLAGNADFYVIADGDPQFISTGFNTLNMSLTAVAPYARYAGAPSTAFNNLRRGDYFFTLQAGTDNGFWKVAKVVTGSFDVERSTVTAGTVDYSNFAFIRTSANIQKMTIPAGTYTLSALAALINSNLENINCYVYKNTKLRISSNGFLNSSILLIDNTATGDVLGFAKKTVVNNSVPQTGFVESSLPKVRTPRFLTYNYASVGAGTVTINRKMVLPTDSLYYSLRDSTTNPSWGSQQNTVEETSDLSVTNTIAYRTNPFLNVKLVNDLFVPVSSVAISPRDNLSLVLDKNPETKTFNINMFRNVSPNIGASYNNLNMSVLDDSNGGVSLFSAFGTTNNFFEDFAVYMRARGKSHSTTANKSILFRNARFGPEGEGVRVAYENPQSENATMTSSISDRKTFGVVNIHLPSGALKTPTELNVNNRFTNTINRPFTTLAGQVSRSGSTVTVTLSPVSNVISHNLKVGDLILQGTDETTGSVFRAGPKVITAVTGNTFSYTEAGAAGVSGLNIIYVTPAWAAGTQFTISTLAWVPGTVTATIGAHPFAVGDTVFFGPGHYHIPTTEFIVSNYVKITAVTATTISWADTVASTATATLVAGVNYTISEGGRYRRTFTESWFPVPTGNMVRASDIVTLTMSMSAQRQITSSHDFVSGDTFYLDSSDANFPSGYKHILSISGDTVTYFETGANIASASTARVGYYNTPVNLSPIIAGDIVNISNESTLLELSVGKVARLSHVTTDTFSYNEDALLLNALIVQTPQAVGNISYLKFYPITATSASSINTWVNSNISDIITSVLVPSNGSGSTTGAATVTEATQEEYLRSVNNGSWNGTGNRSLEAFILFDGVNSVRSCQIDGSNSLIRLKGLVSGELTANADFVNEEFKLSPVTPLKISRWINSPAVSAIFNNGTAYLSDNVSNVTISTNSLGSGGAVEVTGGGANSATAISTSGARTINIRSGIFPDEKGWILEADTDQLISFVGNDWISITNTEKTFKTTLIGAGSQTVTVTPLTSTEAQMSFAQLPFEYANSTVLSSQFVQFENFEQFSKITLSTVIPENVLPGSFVYLTMANASSNNTGLKKVVAKDGNSLWIEGSTTDQFLSGAANDRITYLGYNSWLPGDTIIIDGDMLGPSNNGQFLISGFVLNGTNQITALKVLGLNSGTFLNVLISDIELIEKDLLKCYGQIAAIYPINDTTSRIIIYNNQQTGFYTTTSGVKPAYQKLGEGAVIQSLNKLGFDTNISEGLDGYKYNTGLLAEANKIMYGDESNSFVYPGVVASGTNVNASGSLIKRLKISFGIRTDSSNIADTIARVKNSIATVINNSLSGRSIAISDLIQAANSVEGVSSAVPLYPVYNNVNDVIVIQGNEKARILDLNKDITVTLLG